MSVLIPSYRDAHLVRRSLRRILRGSDSELEVVVVNDAPERGEEIRALVESIDDARIRVVEQERRSGFSRCINAGIDATSGGIVVFANSDLFVGEGYIDRMVEFFERRPRAGCATGKILRFDLAAGRGTNIIDTTGHSIGRNRRVVDRGENQVDVGRYEREEEVFGVSGAALCIRREALASVRVRGEYLDESFDTYKEDVDLCWRLRLAGWECWYVPSAVGYHARTSRGLAGTAYLRGLRQFHENEKRKPPRARRNSMKNHWLLLVKNDDLSNLARDLPYVLGREALVLGYNALFAPRDTAIALREFGRALPGALASRRSMKAQRRASPSEIRRWLVPR